MDESCYAYECGEKKSYLFNFVKTVVLFFIHSVHYRLVSLKSDVIPFSPREILFSLTYLTNGILKNITVPLLSANFHFLVIYGTAVKQVFGQVAGAAFSPT